MATFSSVGALSGKYTFTRNGKSSYSQTKVAASPLSGFYIYPFDLIAIHLDERINIAMRRYENWVSKRTKKYLEPKKEKKAMNNWLSAN